MNDPQNELVKIEFTTAELRKLPSYHAGFFVGSCLAINEIRLFQNLYLMALNTRASSRPISDEALQVTAYSQAVILQRNLAAKVLEYLNMMGDYKKPCERKKDTSMQAFHDESASIAARLRKGEEYELAVWYRNKVTSHYIVSELTSLVRHGDLGDDDTAHPIHLHQREGNCSYVLGEQVLLSKLSEEGASPVLRIERLEEWVLDSSRKAMKLHNEFCTQLLHIFLPEKKGDTILITPESHLVGQLTETCIPILWDFGLLDSPGRANSSNTK